MWRAYGDLPWRQIDDRDQPDLVLIDGRFRVATALTCNRHLRGRTEVPILVDDYFDRAHYSVLEEHLTLRGMHGRMAEFSPSPRETEASAAVLAQYGADWR